MNNNSKKQQHFWRLDYQVSIKHKAKTINKRMTSDRHCPFNLASLLRINLLFYHPLAIIHCKKLILIQIQTYELNQTENEAEQGPRTSDEHCPFTLASLLQDWLAVLLSFSARNLSLWIYPPWKQKLMYWKSNYKTLHFIPIHTPSLSAGSRRKKEIHAYIFQIYISIDEIKIQLNFI